MSITKFESIETQRKQLQHYQDLLAQYTIEYRRLGYQLYTKETEQASINLLLQTLRNLHDMNTALNDLYLGTHHSLFNEFMLLAIKNWLLLARIRKSLLVLDGCLIIKRPEYEAVPTFLNLQKELGWCMDAVVFYKDSVFYVSQITNTLQTCTVPESQREALKEFCTRFFEKPSSLAQPKDIEFLRFLFGAHIGKGEKNVNYIDVIKKIEQSLPMIKFKEDDAFQSDLYNALKEASLQSCHRPEEWAFNLRLPTITKLFIDKCRDNMAKLSYYYTCIFQEIENANPKDGLGVQVKEYSRIFFDIHRKVIQELDSLKQENKLEPIQKADYIRANFYAHYVRMATHPSLQGNRIIEALKEPAKYEVFIKKYIHVAMKERDVYFSNNTAMLLCHDMQDIITDMHAIADYFEITYKVCTELTNQLSFIMQLWFLIRGKPDLAYKEMIFIEARNYLSINSHYYACFNLINNYLTGGDASLRIIPEFDEKYQEMNKLFSVFIQERNMYLMFDKILEAELLENAKMHEKDLLAMGAKNPRITKSKIKTQPIVDAKPIKEKKNSNPQPDYEVQEDNEIDLALEVGRECIKRNAKDAIANFWKAYNLATNVGDIKRRLQAMDCLCYMAGVELNNQLKIIENLAKDSQNKALFLKEASTLLASLPKLRNTYDQYFKLAHTSKSLLSPKEQDAIAYSRDLFWKQFITVQTKLKSWLEQHSQQKPIPAKKTQAIKSQKKTKVVEVQVIEAPSSEILNQELDKHFDDLAQEREPFITICQKDQTSQQVKITLPETIQSIFNFLESFKGTHHLVGSMVIELVLKEFNQSPIVAHDADFISTCMDRASLIIAGFQENSYMRNLYSLFRRFEWPIDLIALPDEDNWLIKSLSSRDFRVAALSCDKDGNIMDYTGYGIDDLKARRLVMIGCPTERFKQDPVLLLRTLKYMIFGFKPEESILHALESWQPDPNTNFSKLFAVARKHLLKPQEAEAFLELLGEFNLLTKIFNVKEKSDVMPLLGLTPKGLSPLSQQSLFKNKPVNQGERLKYDLNGEGVKMDANQKSPLMVMKK